jgi:ribose 5-phosphate isomerase A
MVWVEKAKRLAAVMAVKRAKGGQVIGLGSGSTVEYVIKELARRMKREGLSIRGVPTSYRTMMVAIESGIPLVTLDEVMEVDLAIDGADQIDQNLNLIKGKGGALTREKVVDSTARELVIVVDERKLTNALGVGVKVPIEVIPFAVKVVMGWVEKMGGKVTIRKGRGKVGPVMTENGNFILDADFGRIKNAEELERGLKSLPGVVETGLFLNMADIAYVGCKVGDVKIIKRGK